LDIDSEFFGYPGSPALFVSVLVLVGVAGSLSIGTVVLLLLVVLLVLPVVLLGVVLLVVLLLKRLGEEIIQSIRSFPKKRIVLKQIIKLREWIAPLVLRVGGTLILFPSILPFMPIESTGTTGRSTTTHASFQGTIILPLLSGITQYFVGFGYGTEFVDGGGIVGVFVGVVFEC